MSEWQCWWWWCCRHLPPWEIVEVARYLANLFSCNVESLPTELLTHTYWTLMPRQFANEANYSRCLKTRARAYIGRVCHHINPYYCGRRFGEHAADERLRVCRDLMSGNNATNYTVPPIIRARTVRYRACLVRSRTAVFSAGTVCLLYLRIQFINKAEMFVIKCHR